MIFDWNNVSIIRKIWAMNNTKPFVYNWMIGKKELMLKYLVVLSNKLLPIKTGPMKCNCIGNDHDQWVLNWVRIDDEESNWIENFDQIISIHNSIRLGLKWPNRWWKLLRKVKNSKQQKKTWDLEKPEQKCTNLLIA